MLIKARPVKPGNTKEHDEINEPHIHVVVYGDKLHHMACHWVDQSQTDEMIEIARNLSSLIVKNYRAIVAMNSAIDYADESIFDRQNAKVHAIQGAIAKFINDCKYKILIDTSAEVIDSDQLSWISVDDGEPIPPAIFKSSVDQVLTGTLL